MGIDANPAGKMIFPMAFGVFRHKNYKNRLILDTIQIQLGWIADPIGLESECPTPP